MERFEKPCTCSMPISRMRPVIAVYMVFMPTMTPPSVMIERHDAADHREGAEGLGVATVVVLLADGPQLGLLGLVHVVDDRPHAGLVGRADDEEVDVGPVQDRPQLVERNPDLAVGPGARGVEDADDLPLEAAEAQLGPDPEVVRLQAEPCPGQGADHHGLFVVHA